MQVKREDDYPIDNVLRSWILNTAANCRDSTDVDNLIAELDRVPILTIHKAHALKLIEPFARKFRGKRAS
jgi:hypothetical protein